MNIKNLYFIKLFSQTVCLSCEREVNREDLC